MRRLAFTGSSQIPHALLTRRAYHNEVVFKPPRHLLAVFLLVTLAPAALLLVFGWRMLRQDQEIERRQASERDEQLADLAAASLKQSLDAAGLRLENPGSIPAAADSAVVVLSTGAAAGKLLFYPFTIAGKEAPEGVFAKAEDLEQHGHDLPAAAALFGEIARSSEPSIRSGA